MVYLLPNFLALCAHIFSKLCNKSSQKYLIFLNKANYASYLLACTLPFACYSHEQDLLKTQDVSLVMKNILDEHVDKRVISTEIFKKSIVLYIEQFDPEHMYLLESEVKPYLSLSTSQLQESLDQYQDNQFSLFKQLNTVIQSSIERSRKIREQIEADSKNYLFHSTIDKEQSNQERKKSSSIFAQSVTELKERILLNLEAYIEMQKRRFGTNMTPTRKEHMIQSYESYLRDIENQYLYQNEKGQLLPQLEQENLFTIHVLKAFAASLDAHTSFYETNEAFDLRLHLQKEFKGIGLVLKETGQGPVVSHMITGGPAALSKKIAVGDTLIEIDDQPVINASFDKVMSLLRGEKNSTVKLAFLSKNENKNYRVELTRTLIILNNNRVDTYFEPFGNGIIGMINLHSFYQGAEVSSENDVRNAIKELEKKGILRGLILDLRDNSGGFLSQAVKVAGLFITDGIIVISKYSNGEKKIYRDVDGKTSFDGPLIVLVSKITASAAEIVAQALQDYGVALVVGDEHTYGKGTVQTQTITDNQSSSYFKVTVGKYYTVSGRTPQKEGVKADIIVPGRWNAEDIGEMYADALDGDKIDSYYKDSLADIPSESRAWYLKYYIPKLQKRTFTWRNQLPTLTKNSAYRIAHNKNYQFFLKEHGKDSKKHLENEKEEEVNDGDEEWQEIDDKKKTYGEDDLQVQEAVNILKDMILLQNKENK